MRIKVAKVKVEGRRDKRLDRTNAHHTQFSISIFNFLMNIIVFQVEWNVQACGSTAVSHCAGSGMRQKQSLHQ